MGMPGPFSRSSIGNYNPPNPVPTDFEILMEEKVGKGWVVLVHYNGCTTFGGQKLLVCNKKPTSKKLDPHLLGGDHIVVARFQPNKDGFKLARLCSNNL